LDLEERTVPLKPVFDKAPLTMLTSQPLRAGQVRVNLPALARLYAQVENRREPLLLEGAFRLACLVKADAMQSPAGPAGQGAVKTGGTSHDRESEIHLPRDK